MEAVEERLVDGILSRLHAHGIDSLTADERALLHRVSARYRSRLGKRT
jgi:2-oxo-4-hydroxy-4-carboxy--5-ureidoimidazoline (OHCU) decarboxylase